MLILLAPAFPLLLDEGGIIGHAQPSRGAGVSAFVVRHGEQVADVGLGWQRSDAIVISRNNKRLFIQTSAQPVRSNDGNTSESGTHSLQSAEFR